MIRRKFRSEIETFFQVPFAGREFAADWKISAPCAAAPGHRDLHLFRFALAEKPAAQRLQVPTHRFINPVADDVEEPTFPACCAYPLSDVRPLRCSIYQRSDVYHRNIRKFAEIHPNN